jgi:hypothetical protein
VISEADAPARLTIDYSARSAKSWPVVLYVGAMVWAFATLFALTQLNDGAEINRVRLRTQVTLLSCAAARLVWAVLRKEKGKGWLFYVVLLLLAAPLWFLVTFLARLSGFERVR